MGARGVAGGRQKDHSIFHDLVILDVGAQTAREKIVISDVNPW
jgi:hypothetical protein